MSEKEQKPHSIKAVVGDTQLGPDKLPFEAYMEAREKYIIDPVTGALNRAGFFEEAKKAIRKSPNPENVAVIILDLDKFKPLNDSQGHGVGDLALRSTTEFLGEELRKSDLVAHTRGRIGGDEFIVLADLTPREENSTQTKEERLTTLISRISGNYGPAMSEKNELFRGLSVSAGGAFYEPGTQLEDTIKQADERMYVQKQALGGGSR